MDLSDRMEQWYEAWCDSPDYFEECDEYGKQRAAFFAGIHAGAREIRRAEAPAPVCPRCQRDHNEPHCADGREYGPFDTAYGGPMTDLPTGAVDAVEASLRNFLSRWADFTVHGTDLDSQLRGAAMIAVRETLAYLADPDGDTTG